MSGEGNKGRKGLVHGAEFDYVYLDDLTTAKGTKGRPYTNPTDWGGLHAKDTHNPTGVPGVQMDGYFLDEDSTTSRAPGNAYGNKRYPFDSQFVIRFPTAWNGRLVITGAPGIRGQYANDFIISDFVLKKGYAFASTDKGNSGLRFYSAGETPGAAVAEWHRRVKQLTEAAKDAAEKYYGEEPAHTYITGTSNAGYLTRYALERHPDLYDGGVDWAGVLWRPEGPNLLTFLPMALKHYPKYIDPEESQSCHETARDSIIEAGFPEGSEFLWQYHYDVYWNSVQRIFREEFDPYYLSSDVYYDYPGRPQEVKNAVMRVSLTGKICKPLISLHGTLDTLLPIKKTSDIYADLVNEAGRSDLHRYYRIEGGNHVDGLYDYTGPNPNNPNPEFREKLRPMLPCYRAAFDRLVEWVEQEEPPPQNQTVPKPADGDVVNSCPPLEG
jgi:hypothetical protein